MWSTFRGGEFCAMPGSNSWPNYPQQLARLSYAWQNYNSSTLSWCSNSQQSPPSLHHQRVFGRRVNEKCLVSEAGAVVGTGWTAVMIMMMMMMIPTYVLNSQCCHYEQASWKLVSVSINKHSAVLGIALNFRCLLFVAFLCVSKHHDLYRNA